MKTERKASKGVNYKINLQKSIVFLPTERGYRKNNTVKNNNQKIKTKWTK